MRLASLVLGVVVTLLGAVQAQAQLTISPNTLPFGGLSQSYTAQLTANGSGSYNWAVASGNLPPGLNLDQFKGAIFGAPTAVGTYSFVIRVNDLQTEQTTTKNFSIGVMQINTATPLPNAALGTFYSITFTISDGPQVGAVWSGPQSGLPNGLTLASNGTLSGTPTAAGTFNFPITVVAPSCNPCFNSSNPPTITANKNFSLTVSSTSSTLTINNQSFPDTEVGLQYSQQVSATGGAPPYQYFTQTNPFSPTGLPPGITLDQFTGILSGAATTSGTFTFTLIVQDSASTKAQKQFTINVAGGLTFTTPSPLPDGTRGVAYSQVITVTGGVPPYMFFGANVPPGLILDKNGGLTGTPTAPGTFIFSVNVVDKLGGSSQKNYQVTFADVTPPTAPVKTTPTSLSFVVPFMGSAPPPQFIDVTPTGTLPAAFKVQVDMGPNTQAPNWISVTPIGAVAPARLIVRVNQGSMPIGKYSARILVIDNTPNFTTVTVDLAIVDTPPRFDITPGFLRFRARVGAPGAQEQDLTVSNGGGGQPFSFTAAVLPGDSNFITSVLPNTGMITPNSSQTVRVLINTGGLGVGSYRLVIRFTTPFGTFDVPVTLFVAQDGPILGVNVTGLRFQAVQNGGFTAAQTVKLLNVGTGSLTWTAVLANGSDLFTFSVSGNTATPASPGTISITPTQSALQKDPNGYFALLKITSSAQNSPQYVVLLLDLASSTSPPLPDLSPTGFTFVVNAGIQSQPQTLTINTTSADATPFEIAVNTSDGANWLQATPTSGTVSSKSPAVATITVNAPPALAGRILTGEVSVSESGVIRTATVTAIVLTSPTTAAADQAPTAGCIPTKVAITTTGLVNNFGVPAKWPEPLIVQLNDDCGNPLLNGSVAASFSNGDPPLPLRGDGQTGQYSASWQPVQDTTQMVVNLQASSATLQPATLQLLGTITPNTAPVLSANGTVDPFNRQGGAALAPGTLVEVYGSGLASSQVSPGILPLPPIFNGTFVTVGGFQAPFTFLSSGQLNVQLPFELTPNQQYPILVSANNAFTLPDTIDIVPLKPEVASFADGHIIAQHSDFSLVDATHPAKPGEFLVMYLLGMGPTSPSVATGAAAPAQPLAQVVNAPKVTVSGQTANVVFAGLTPGLSGLYQINFQVPAGTSLGDVDVVVSQNGVLANTTKLPVSN